jgi:Xaa-Pro aminopeptidase
VAPVFPDGEYLSRQQRLRERLAADAVDLCVISSPESICYLTGHATPGYYTFQTLIFPTEGEPVLVMREAEVVNAEELAFTKSIRGYPDNVDPILATAAVVREAGGVRNLGVDERSWSLTPFQYRQLVAELSPARTSSVDAAVTGLRLIKSALEIAAIRHAARIVNRAAAAAVEAIEPGVRERDVAATIFDVMVREGSEYLGMEPFVASGPRSGRIHASWTDRRIAQGEPVLFELAAAHHRYHAVLMHTVWRGNLPDDLRRVADTCARARDATLAAMRPGNSAEDCHRACVDAIAADGLLEYYRKRTGYSVGLAFAPDWGEGGILSLGYGQQTKLEPGMVFHAVPAIRIPGRGGVGLSATVLIAEEGFEILTQTA